MRRWIAIAACLLINGAFVHRLLAQHSTHGYLGIGVANITDERVKALKLKDDRGVVIMNVGDDTPAAKAGLKESDVITEFNGQAVDGVEQFTRLVRETPPNRKVTIRIIRDGAAQTANATLTAARALPPHMEDFNVQIPAMPPMPPMPDAFWSNVPSQPGFGGWRQRTIGVEVEPVSGQLAEYFGVKEGVLIRSVAHESPSEKAGLKAGDVVIRVDATAVKTQSELSRGIRSASAKSVVNLTIVRNRKETSVTVKLLDKDDEN